ncbi:MAG: hypothetical protein V4850_10350 [Myxococcota bacterium]
MARSVFRRVVFATLLGAMSLAAFEGIARVLPASATADRGTVVREITGDDSFVSDGEVPGWDIDPGGGDNWGTRYTVNRWRMRGPDYSETKGEGVKRVIFVGDSSVFGVLLDWPDTFSARFERLRDTATPGTDWQVANCACPGHSTEQSRRKLERQCLAFQPDYVVIANQFSDATRESAADIERFGLTREIALTRAAEHFAGYRLLRNTWLRARGADAVVPHEIPQMGIVQNGKFRRVPPEDYEANLRRMVAIVRESGATPVFLLLASRDDLQEGVPSSSQDYRDAMRLVAEQEGVPLADAAKQFAKLPRVDGLFEDQVHPGPVGAGFVALLLNETVPR